jgi:hypothetical protein
VRHGEVVDPWYLLSMEIYGADENMPKIDTTMNTDILSLKIGER